ncbi:MAG: helix-turn-helix domain-containing protein [Candidatus Atribacteria bacterium]|nr:helix-turn-helix domain-containing protein [Candidatus Atribacteria bacterium]
MEEFYTVEEVAQKLKVTEYVIRKWIREKKLKAVKIGRLWRVPESALREFLKINGKGEDRNGGS